MLIDHASDAFLKVCLAAGMTYDDFEKIGTDPNAAEVAQRLLLPNMRAWVKEIDGRKPKTPG